VESENTSVFLLQNQRKTNIYVISTHYYMSVISSRVYITGNRWTI